MISIEELYKKFQECSGVSTDTRKIGENTMFFALKGPKFNANTFAAEALVKGARYAIVDEAAFATDEHTLLVADGLKALQDLALYHRRQLKIPFFALTGSNGKTTTKELINCVLSKKYKTYATQGNLNNHIGVPLTLLAIDETIEMAIVEMGANKQGDIKELVEIGEPSHGFITNIGKAHLEGFGGLAGVRKGKGEMFDWLAASGGTVFVSSESLVTSQMANERTGFGEKITYDSSLAQLVDDNPFVIFESDGKSYQSHLTGKYNFENMLAAIAVGRYFGVSLDDACQAVADYNPKNNRSEVVERASNTILMDAYNANPSSMSAAISNFDQMKADKKMVILGDMFELGEDGPSEHAALGELISKCNFDYVLLAGDLMQHALVHVPKAYYFPDKFGLHLWLKDHPLTHTHILVKGSRGMGLESVLTVL
jgi:UDP-N-acetylmuramoyl-tripeptide--D-alanyl-D-alanine ligase